HIREASPTGSRPVEAPTVRVRGSSRRPDPPGVGARRAGTCHHAVLLGATVTNFTNAVACAWFGTRRCTENKESPECAGAFQRRSKGGVMPISPSLDLQILSQGTAQARRGSRKRPDRLPSETTTSRLRRRQKRLL